MRIVFVHNAYTSYRVPLFNALSKHFDVDFLFHKIYGSTEERPDFNFEVLFGLGIPFIESAYTFAPFLFIHLLKKKYHVFIGAGSGYVDTLVTFLIAKLLRKPFILWDVSWFTVRSFLRLLRFPFDRHIALHSDAVVLPGSKSKEFFMAMGVSEDKIFRSPNVSLFTITNDTKKKSKVLKNSLKVKRKERIILYFGRIMEEKGIHYLIQAFHRLQKEIDNTRLIVACSIPREHYEKIISYSIREREEYERELIDLCNRIGNIDILNVVTDDEKIACFHLADVFVLPSIYVSPQEGLETWGLVLNEAMSIGKPVIATNIVGGAYDLIISGYNGFIVPEKDIDALHTAMREIITDHDLRLKMSMRSMNLIQTKFKLEDAVSGFRNAIEYVSWKNA